MKRQLETEKTALDKQRQIETGRKRFLENELFLKQVLPPSFFNSPEICIKYADTGESELERDRD